jgi:hypothetical protein
MAASLARLQKLNKLNENMAALQHGLRSQLGAADNEVADQERQQIQNIHRRMNSISSSPVTQHEISRPAAAPEALQSIGSPVLPLSPRESVDDGGGSANSSPQKADASTIAKTRGLKAAMKAYKEQASPGKPSPQQVRQTPRRSPVQRCCWGDMGWHPILP